MKIKEIAKLAHKYRGGLCVACAFLVSVQLMVFFGISGAANYLVFILIFGAAWFLFRKIVNLPFERRAWIFSSIVAAVSAFTFLLRSKINWGEVELVAFSRQDIFSYLALFLIFAALVRALLSFTPVKKLSEPKGGKKAWLFYFLIIFICWLPYFIIFFPGIGGGWDSFWQIAQSMGISGLSNHHPVAHTLFMGIFINIGRFFGSLAAGMALYSLAQMATVAAILSYVTLFFAKHGVSKRFRVTALLFFALNPIIALYSITPWKDVLFGAFLLWMATLLFMLVKNPKEFLTRKIRVFALIGCLLLVGLFRNNGIYILLLLSVVIVVVMRLYWKKLALIFFGAIVTVIVIQGPIYSLMGVIQPSFMETIGVPLQQIGYAAKYGTLTDDQKNRLSQIIDPKRLVEAYNPTTPDNIKNAIGHSDFIEKDKAGFIRLWLDIMMTGRNFLGYVKAYALTTAPYWQVGYSNWCCSYDNAQPTEYPVHLDTGHRDINWIHDVFGFDARKAVGSIIEREVHNSVWSGWIFDIGLNAWVMIIAIVVLLYRRCYKYLIVLVPTFGLWATLLLASPLAIGFRYTFAIHLTLPLFVFLIMTMSGKTKNRFFQTPTSEQ